MLMFVFYIFFFHLGKYFVLFLLRNLPVAYLIFVMCHKVRFSTAFNGLSGSWSFFLCCGNKMANFKQMFGFHFWFDCCKMSSNLLKSFCCFEMMVVGKEQFHRGRERERTLSVKMEEMNKNNVLWGKMGKGIRNIKKILLSRGGKAHEKRWVK